MVTDLCVDAQFIFQAEDGIRDYKVTGVQTCALPICPSLGTNVLYLTGRVCPRCGAGRGARVGYAGRITSPVALSTTTLIDSSGVRVGPAIAAAWWAGSNSAP